MSTEQVFARREVGRQLPSGEYLHADAKLYRLGGNRRPYFSVTGEVWQSEGWYKNGQDGRCHSAGQVSELDGVAEIAPVRLVHLADDDGCPMHAAANGWYWYERGELDALARVYRVAEAEIPGGLEAETFAEWMESLRPAWLEQAREALRALGVRYVLRHDGVICWCGQTENGALGALHHLQGQSADYALKWGGYSFESIEGVTR